MAAAFPRNESLNFLTHRSTSGRKPVQIYFVVVFLGSTMNFPMVEIFEVLSGDDQ